MQLVLYPDEKLSTACRPIDMFDDNLRTVVENMSELMYSSRGVGLAAPQVGLNIDLILVDPSGGDTAGQLLVMVNPQLSFPSKKSVKMNEGCLSIPNVYVSVERPEVVHVLYQDLGGVTKSVTLDGWPSRIAQHEHDHLRGALMLDRIGPLSRKTALKDRSRVATHR